ncbi:MAG: magnesium transporter [Gemmatimonadaceae bacterium]
MLSQMRPVDVAEALSRLHPDAAAQLIKALPFDLVVQVFDEPELEGRAEIFQKIDAASAAPLLEAMSADQQADLFRELTPPERERLAKPLDAPTRSSLALLLRYPPEVAGGIMTTEAVTVPFDWTVEQALQYIVSVGGAKETVYTIYVLDGQQKMIHVVSLRQLMMADRNAKVVEIGPPRVPLTVKPTTDREDVARLLSKYNLLAVPVVDDDGKLLGIVTVDDVIDAIVSEQTEDVQKFGGMEALDEPYMEISIYAMIKKRAGWLSALFLGEMLTATAMTHFADEISKAVVLALFMPLIISSGGNSGSQATSLIIRAMALREVTLKDWWRVAARELPSGLILGSILGVLGFARIMIWQTARMADYGPHHTLVALTVAFSLIGVVMFGSLAGSMLPFVMRRLNFDPASASAPFVATLVDVTGLIIYFSVALTILRGTLL